MKKMSVKSFNYLRDFVRVLLVILVFATISVFWNLNQTRDYYQAYISHAAELRILMLETTKYSGIALVGSDQEGAFRSLKNASVNIERELDILLNGIMVNQKEVLPPSNDKIKFTELNALFGAWEALKPKVNLLLDNQNQILSLRKTSDSVINNIQKLQEIYWDIADNLGNGVVDNNQKIIKIAHLINLGSEVVAAAGKILTVSENSNGSLKAFFDNANRFLKDAQSVQEGAKDSLSVTMITDMDKYRQSMQSDVDAVKNISGLVGQSNAAVFTIFNQVSLLANLSKNLEVAYSNYPKTHSSLELYAYGLGLLSFLVLILSFQLFHKESENHLKMIEEKNNLMQAAVDKLLKELPEIASGNSSLGSVMSLNIGDHPTQLAESFTYALSTLRKLVFNIGKMSKNVSVAAKDAQKISEELAASSGNQAQEITEVTASVSAMASTIEHVSVNAAESASVALESVKIAGEGGKVVRNTIGGMERIQTQIQETSNFMRRLSESSQEIGEIVSLIDGIADQTNILSLNAAIQAAMAGEAGRGFAVVADEVQRLAEKVSYATKEIGSLVKSIQTDTTQVIVAMDQTKAQVLEGVSSAQAAGSTLEKIETVSRRLSDLIQNISLSSKEQVTVSSKISQIMNDIKDIAQQTASGSTTTVDLIIKLSQFVTDLRNSVLELKLPDDKK